jgi:hypothetical protein
MENRRKKHRTKTKRSPESRQEVAKLSSKFKNTYIIFTIFNYLFMRKRKFGREGENTWKTNAKHGKENRLTEAKPSGLTGANQNKTH